MNDPTAKLLGKKDPSKKDNLPATPERRGFFTKAAAVTLGALVTVFPFLAGLTVISDPLRRGQRKIDFLRIATLESLPDDGVPRQFPVIADRRDAWTHYPPEPIGTVFLIRDPGQDTVHAFNAVCPHAGCLVGYLAAKQYFLCPCHTSAFALDGAVLTNISRVSPRALDSLACEVRPSGDVHEVWVKFENFQTGISEKIPTA